MKWTIWEDLCRYQVCLGGVYGDRRKNAARGIRKDVNKYQGSSRGHQYPVNIKTKGGASGEGS